MTTIITLSHNTNKLPEIVSNWNELNDQTKEFLLSCSDFRIMNSQEMLTYNGRQIESSCMIEVWDDSIKILNCYNRNSEKLF